jgi:Zn-dependent protease with chaperone function/tellurite resistance protein
LNFFEHQDSARRQSRWLFLVFILAVLAIVAAIDLVVLLALGVTGWEPQAEPMSLGQTLRANLPLLGGAAIATVVVIGLASLFKMASLRSGGGEVARQLGGTPVEPDTRDPLRRRLRNVVEEIALASGVPVPEIYVLDKEAGINAFAAGYTPADAAVAVTRGALEKLSRNELQGVIAHEFSHILNGDMRINIRLMGALFGILVLALVGRRVVMHAHLAGRSSRDRNGAVVLLIAFGLMAIGYIGLFFGRWIKAAVSRQREYLADASAVQFTRDPAGIGGALKKIAVYSESSWLDTDTEEVSHMLFGDGQKMRLFSTHPPLVERIQRVEPGFHPDDLARLAAEIQRDRIRHQKEQAEQARHVAAAAEGRGGGFDAQGIIDGIGKPEWERMLMAAALAASVPRAIDKAVHSLEWAPEALFYCLLDSDSEIRQRQLLLIAQSMGAESETRVRALYDAAGPVLPEQRLPLLEMAFPVLKRRPPDFLRQVLDTVKSLAAVDGRTEVFEYLLARSVSQHLWESANPDRVKLAGRRELAALQGEALDVLAVAARKGQSGQKGIDAAFRSGVEALGIEAPPSLPDTKDWVAVLDAALPRLDRLKPSAKERLVRALIAVVTHDGRVEAVEMEALRVVCGLLHVPLPLISTPPRTSPQS